MSNRDDKIDNELREVIVKFETALKENRTLYLDSEQYEELTEFYAIQGNINRACEAIEMGIRIHPDNVKLIAMQIALHIDCGNHDEAKRLMETVKHSPSLPIQLVYCEMLSAEGRNEEAQEILSALQKEDINESECIDIAYSCLDTGRGETAVYWFERSLSMDPENVDAFMGLCEAYQILGKYEKTIDIYNKLLDKEPYNADYWLQLGRSYFQLERYDKAIDASEFAIVSEERCGAAFALKAYAFLQLKNYEASNEAYLMAWRYGALDTHLAFMLVGFNYMDMKDWEQASKYLNKAIEKAESDSFVLPEIYTNLATCFFKMKKYDDAHDVLNSMQLTLPSNITSYLYNGKYYLKEGDRIKAFECFDRAFAINSSDSIWFIVGIMALNSNFYQLALSIFEKIESNNTEINDLSRCMTQVAERLETEGLDFNEKEVLLKQLNAFFDHAEKNISSSMPNMIPLMLPPIDSQFEDGNIFELKLMLDELTEMIDTFEIDNENG